MQADFALCTLTRELRKLTLHYVPITNKRIAIEVYFAKEAHVCKAPLYVPTGIEKMIIMHSIAVCCMQYSVVLGRICCF